MLEQLAQGKHGCIGIGMTEDLHAVGLKLSIRDCKYRLFRSPVQRQRQGCNAAIGQRRRCTGCRDKVHISARKHLILHKICAAAKCH